jgi:hypothetical protein
MAATAGRTTAKFLKPSCGNLGLERLGEIYPLSFVLGKQPTIGLIAGQPKGYGMLFF